jgi:hypothetical protein
MLYHDLPRGRNRNGLLDKIVETAPFKISGTQADGGSEFKSVFEEEAKGAASNSSSCPPKARPQWLRRTRPIDLEVRILRRLRPAAHNRKTASLRRCLRRPLQHPKTARGPCRTNSRRISKIPQLRRPRKVSYVLSPDTALTSKFRYARVRRAMYGKVWPGRHLISPPSGEWLRSERLTHRRTYAPNPAVSSFYPCADWWCDIHGRDHRPWGNGAGSRRDTCGRDRLPSNARSPARRRS